MATPKNGGKISDDPSPTLDKLGTAPFNIFVIFKIHHTEWGVEHFARSQLFAVTVHGCPERWFC